MGLYTTVPLNASVQGRSNTKAPVYTCLLPKPCLSVVGKNCGKRQKGLWEIKILCKNEKRLQTCLSLIFNHDKLWCVEFTCVLKLYPNSSLVALFWITYNFTKKYLFLKHQTKHLSSNGWNKTKDSYFKRNKVGFTLNHRISAHCSHNQIQCICEDQDILSSITPSTSLVRSVVCLKKHPALKFVW